MPVTDIKHARPYHIGEMITQYDTGGIWAGDTFSGSGTVDTSAAEAAAGAVITDIGNEIDTDKATCITNTDGILEAGKSSWPFANQTAFDNFIDSLKTSIAGAINADIAINVSAYTADVEDAISNNIDGGSISVAIKDVLIEVKANYETQVQAEYTYPCPECGTSGLKPVYDSSGIATTETEESPLCDGFGWTTDEYRAAQPTGYVPV